MDFMQKTLVFLTALLHLGFLVMEMFLWKTSWGQKIFRLDSDFAVKSAVLAANQGLYNGFLCAGLIWSLCTTNAQFAMQLRIFFLICMLIAGIYGGLTANKNIFFIQALPALLALLYGFKDPIVRFFVAS